MAAAEIYDIEGIKKRARMNQQQLGAVQMTTAMALSGGVGVWVSALGGTTEFAVVFWRCVFGFIALLAFMFVVYRPHT